MGDGSCQVLCETDEPAVAPVGDASARRSGGFERLGAGDAHRSARRSARFGTPSQQIAGLAGGSRHGVDFALLGHSLDIYFGSAVRFDRAPAYGKIDLDFLMELGERRIPFAIIFTKGDKQGVNVLAAQIEKDKKQLLEFWEELPPCFVSSSETGAGREEILDYIGGVLDNLGKDDDGTPQNTDVKSAEKE